MMRVKCTSAITRPHLSGEDEGLCWCNPVAFVAGCECHEGQVMYGHGEVEVRPDVRERMAVFR